MSKSWICKLDALRKSFTTIGRQESFDKGKVQRMEFWQHLEQPHYTPFISKEKKVEIKTNPTGWNWKRWSDLQKWVILGQI